MTMSFDAFYHEAPVSMAQELRDFRLTHHPRHVVWNGVTWTYTVSGHGEQPLLWLVGALRVGDAAFRSIPLLETDFKIILPDYPPVMSMAELTDGLAAILTAEGIGATHVLAGSMGGMIAQVFAHRHPDRVNKLILSTTTPPDPTGALRYQEQLSMIEGLDAGVVLEGAKLQMLNMLQPPPVDIPFWQAYLNELLTVRLGKADLMSSYALVLDYMANYQFTPDDFVGWTNRILLIDSDNDSTFGPEVQHRLKMLYPMALGYTFQGAGHSPGSTQKDAYFGLVRNFLLGITG